MAWGAGRETEMQDYEMHVYDESTDARKMEAQRW